MGRHAKGWQLFAKPNGILHVRFRVRGVRSERTTGEREIGPATARAEVLYASAVGGNLVTRGKRANAIGRPLDELCLDWTEQLKTSLDAGTIAGYFVYAKHWVQFFPTVHGITTATAEAYARHRLGRVVRKTVRKELSALRSFVAWCKAVGVLEDAPVIPTPAKNVLGTRSDPLRKTEAVELSEAEALRIVAALPEKSRKVRGRYRTPRAFFAVLWHTGLRPKTIGFLEVPRHYSQGAHELTITPDIDKARYERKVPLTKEARAALDSVCPTSGRIFVSYRFAAELRKAALVARLLPEKCTKVTVYDFRHARATDLAMRTGDLPGTAYLLGHKQLTTTNRYLHPSRRAGDRVIDKIRVQPWVQPQESPSRTTTKKKG